MQRPVVVPRSLLPSVTTRRTLMGLIGSDTRLLIVTWSKLPTERPVSRLSRPVVLLSLVRAPAQPPQHAYFGSRSHTPSSRCLRFDRRVAATPARLAPVLLARLVWTPPPVQEESLNSCGAGSGAAMCPASAAAAHRPRARMGVRGSGPHHWSALEALSSHLVLLIPSHRRLRHTCPSTSSRHRQPHARRPLMRRRPELDNFRPWRSTPTRSAPSCWPAPPSPASAACGRACAPARSPRARPCAAPSAPRHWPQ